MHRQQGKNNNIIMIPLSSHQHQHQQHPVLGSDGNNINYDDDNNNNSTYSSSTTTATNGCDNNNNNSSNVYNRNSAGSVSRTKSLSTSTYKMTRNTCSTNNKATAKDDMYHKEQKYLNKNYHWNEYYGSRWKQIILFFLMIALWIVWMNYYNFHLTDAVSSDVKEQQQKIIGGGGGGGGIRKVGTDDKEKQLLLLPSGFDTMYARSIEHHTKCMKPFSDDNKSFPGYDLRSVMPFLQNETVASLPSFGIIQAIEEYYDNNNREKWPVCTMPPDNECNEKQITVIFMAYNPDRLGILLKQIQKMLDPNQYYNLVQQIIIVWNGIRHVDETDIGKQFLQYVATHTSTIKIVYPLQMGYPNDLMNRYHPNIVGNIITKAVMYYDDDGPFYSYEATISGFELWKRHSKQQMGAMSRELTYSTKQRIEWNEITNHGTNRSDMTPFLSHCTYKEANQGDDVSIIQKAQQQRQRRQLKGEKENLIGSISSTTTTTTTTTSDLVDYNFRYFANYDANMVLPSGSMIHVNYLCYIWHPIFANIRQFVLDHPVHPDDMTVSMIVSQLSGMPPRVYSRRIAKPTSSSTSTTTDNKNINNKRRRLLSDEDVNNNRSKSEVTTKIVHDTFERSDEADQDDQYTEDLDHGIIPISEKQRHRKLLFNINWDANHNMDEMKQYWADLRKEAINSLVRYFGSINSGSIGWCENTKHYDISRTDGKCKPIMAERGMLHWMKPDGTPKDTCP